MPRHTLPAWCRLIPCVATLCLSSVDAQEPFWTGLQIHGFASQAAVATSDNRFFGNSPDWSFDFTEIAVNASVALAPRIRIAAQILARRAGDMYDGTPALDYGLADLSLVSSTEQRLGVRIGRLKNPLGIYNETRDVPFTHPGIFLPQVVYFDKVRNLMLSTDGLMLYADSYRANAGTFSLIVGGGKSVIDENVEWTYLYNDFTQDLANDGLAWVTRLWYASPDERLKIGWSSASLTLALDPEAPLRPQRGSLDIFYWIASFQYEAEDWTLTAEFAREPLEWRGFSPYFPDTKATSEGWYVQGTYRLLPSVELLLCYQEGLANRYDRDGSIASAASGGLIPPHNGFSRIGVVGLRWDIDRHWMVRAEYQRNDGVFILSPRENPDFGRLEPQWDLFALQIAFRF